MARQKKAVRYEAIPEFEPGETEPVYTEPYRLLQELLAGIHRRIPEAGARILLVWRKGWKPDRDGRLTLGQCRKASDLERVIQGVEAYDFVILLNKEAWNVFDRPRRLWLLDHECCHAAFVHDEQGVKRDEHNRPVTRIRKHDLEEFGDIYERHGAHVSAALERFAVITLRQADAQGGILFDPRSGEMLAGSAGDGGGGE